MIEVSSNQLLRYKAISSHINGLLETIWEKTAFSPSTIYKDIPEYNELVEMGDKIIPYIISRMVSDHARWVHIALLHDLTKGEYAVPEDHQGKFYVQICDWLNWYLTSKYYEKDDVYHGLVD